MSTKNEFLVPHPLRVSKGAGLFVKETGSAAEGGQKTRTLAKVARVRHPIRTPGWKLTGSRSVHKKEKC
jgi:hypothetical protein